MDPFLFFQNRRIKNQYLVQIADGEALSHTSTDRIHTIFILYDSEPLAWMRQVERECRPRIESGIKDVDGRRQARVVHAAKHVYFSVVDERSE